MTKKRYENISILLVGKYNTKLVKSESHFFAGSSSSSSSSFILTWKKKKEHITDTHTMLKNQNLEKFDDEP